MIPVTCGLTPSESYAKWDRDSACWKTYQLSLLTNTVEPLSGSYRRAGIACDGRLYRLPSLEHRIGEIGSGLWPTMTVTTAEHPGLRKRGDLLQAVRGNPNKHYKLYPTPTSGEHTRNKSKGEKSPIRWTLIGMARYDKWPTPTSRDHKDGTNVKNVPVNALLGRAVRPTKTKGSLDPEFVEYLMGFPIGFTDLKPLGMDRFQQWLEQHGICSRENDGE